MIDVIYQGPYSAVVTAGGIEFPKGVAVSVDEALGKSLINQGFKIAPANKNEGK